VNDQSAHTADAIDTTSATLAEEHALLLHEVTVRGDAVTGEADTSHWPSPALRRLLDYLFVEVLQQVSDEEWRLFRTWGDEPERLIALRAGHLRLREEIENLTDAAMGVEPPSADRLSELVTGLIATLTEHFRAEQLALRCDTRSEVPSTAALGGIPHEWYTLAEGPDVDLDALPGPEGSQVVMARLLRLRPGECLELHGATDPGLMLQRLAATHPGTYGVTYLQREPQRWRVEVRCRTAA
jgi:uncharacterized protein (DUF2249 family)